MTFIELGLKKTLVSDHRYIYIYICILRMLYKLLTCMVKWIKYVNRKQCMQDHILLSVVPKNYKCYLRDDFYKSRGLVLSHI